MNHHHEWILYIANLPIVAALVSAPWWIEPVTKAIEEFHWVAGMLILPVLGIVLAGLQVAYMIRKHKRL